MKTGDLAMDASSSEYNLQVALFVAMQAKAWTQNS